MSEQRQTKEDIEALVRWLFLWKSHIFYGSNNLNKE